VQTNINTAYFTWANDNNLLLTKPQTLSYTTAQLIQNITNLTSEPQKLNYTIKGYNGGCLGETATKSVVVMPSYEANLPIDDQLVCKGDNFEIQIPALNKGYKLKWYKNDTLLSNTSNLINEKITQKTVLLLQVTDYCDNTEEQYLQINTHSAQFLSDFKLIDSCMNFKSTLMATIPSYLNKSIWKINNEDEIERKNNSQTTELHHLFPSSGKNKINIKGYLNNCYLLDTTITVEIVNCTVEARNTISPNNDGQNDFWEIKGIEKYPSASLEIFDRWGQKIKVISNNIPFQAWDGTNNEGVNVEDGTYYYVINFPNSTLNVKGHINVIR
jgi:gliding motility-associated-like protein